MSQEFRDAHRVDNVVPIRPNLQSPDMDNDIGGSEYSAPKGTAKRHNANKTSKNGLKLKIAALIMAGALGVGGMAVSKNASDVQHKDILALQEMGEDITKLGLSRQTIDMLLKYEQYFSNMDSINYADITKEDLTQIINEIESLHFGVVKEKVAYLENRSVEDIQIYYNYEPVNEIMTSIRIRQEGQGFKKAYTDVGNKLNSEAKMPELLSKIIMQLKSVDELRSSIQSDQISHKGAIRKIEKLYKNLGDLSTKQIIKDENGTMKLVSIKGKEQEER